LWFDTSTIEKVVVNWGTVVGMSGSTSNTTTSITYTVLDPTKIYWTNTLSTDKLTVDLPWSGPNMILSKDWVSSWKWYWEIKMNNAGGGWDVIWVNKWPTSNTYPWTGGNGGNSFRTWDWKPFWWTTAGQSWLICNQLWDIVGFAFDADIGKIDWYVNWKKSSVSMYVPTWFTYFAWVSSNNYTFNFGQNPFAHPENIPVWFNKWLWTIN
ncbi:MAG: hypothetical protein ACD_49C00001G0001, partial [uncultured bacterium (gcode 4)]